MKTLFENVTSWTSLSIESVPCTTRSMWPPAFSHGTVWTPWCTCRNGLRSDTGRLLKISGYYSLCYVGFTHVWISLDGYNGAIGKHSNQRGTVLRNFVYHSRYEKPDTAESYTMTIKNATIFHNTTDTYQCASFDLPSSSTTNSILGYHSHINSKYVHHIVTFFLFRVLSDSDVFVRGTYYDTKILWYELFHLWVTKKTTFPL